ncbi:hypothetical protein ACFWPK_15050 [Nocardia sp. NPDC058519]|uniref:hypothetical protein n=1 Tax=Nocardia sp. NPDC058519 TaxID=3346535 RepID=UPI00365F024E
MAALALGVLVSVWKFLIESAFGPVFAIAGAGLILLVVAAFLWDVVAAAVNRVRDRFGGGDRAEAAEPIRERKTPNTRRTAESRDRRSARIAARRSAIHAKHATAADIDG